MMLAPGRLGRIGRLGFDAKPAALSPYLPASELLFAAWAAADSARPTPASVGQKIITDDFIRALKGANPLAVDLLAGIDVFYDGAVQGFRAGAINWKTPGSFTATIDGNPVHTPFLYGYQGDGVLTAFRTGFVPATHGVNVTRDSHAIIARPTANAQDEGVFAGTIGARSFYIYPRYSDDTAYGLDGGGDPIFAASTDAMRTFALDRGNGTSYKLLIEGVQAAFQNDQVSAALTNELSFLIGVDGGSARSTLPFGIGIAMRHGTDAEHLVLAGLISAYVMAKNTADLIVYSGDSYCNDPVLGPALPVSADSLLSTDTKAVHVLKGAVAMGRGKTSVEQLAEWTNEIRPLYSPGRDNILVLVPATGDRSNGTDGETTINGMLARYQTIIDQAVGDGWKVVLSTIPAWSFASLGYTVSTYANYLTLTAGILARTGVDAVCDISDDPQLCGQTAYLNPTFFQPYPADVIPHLTLAGYARWSTRLAPAIESVR